MPHAVVVKYWGQYYEISLEAKEAEMNFLYEYTDRISSAAHILNGQKNTSVYCSSYWVTKYKTICNFVASILLRFHLKWQLSNQQQKKN